jgi:hypothetical protein
MMIRPFQEDAAVDGRGCVGLWLQGLLGDVILASTYFDEILRQDPHRPWIIVHSYRDPARVHAVLDVLRPFFASQRIRGYFFHPLPSCMPMPAEVSRLFAHIGVDRVVEFMFDRLDRTRLTRPQLGIDLDRPRTRKAILMRRSGWNAHFPARNRPVEEWRAIESTLLERGFEPYVVGVDDDMPVTAGVTDRRHSMSPREVLVFASDAGLVVSCTTFLPVFTQFVCPSLVICDPLDEENQRANWRITEHYRVHPARPGYLGALAGQVGVEPI